MPLPATQALPAPATTLAAATAARNAWIAIDLDALATNISTLRATIGPGVETIAVVKANAYGHGAHVLAPELERLGVERFAVFALAEAVALRAAGVSRPIVVLGNTFPSESDIALAYDITLTCNSLDLAHALSQRASEAGTTARVHVKVDTGLHRFGLALDDACVLADRIRHLPGIAVTGLYTHMANADEADDGFSAQQHLVFREAARRLPWIPYRHTANSATALRRPELRYEGVRFGLALHGVLPPETPGIQLTPTLSLKARLARVSTIAPGEGVSYGLAWKASRPSRIGLVPVGYADGWRRNLGNAGAVLVAGQRCPIVGRIAMDQFVIDITTIPAVAEGEEAVLIGTQGVATITADDVAAAAGTISWDVVASLGGRLPRIYHRAGLVTAIVEPSL